MKPKISVIMSFYNNEKYIKEAIASILNQTFSDFEFLIVNDGSTDKSYEIIKKFFDRRIKVLHNKKNLGLTKSLNIALKIAKGEFVARMDADDIAFSKRFEKQVGYLEKNKKVALVGSWVEFIDEMGKSTGIKKFPQKDKEIRKKLMSYLPFRHSTLMVRKEVLDDLGFYDESFRFAQDYEFVFRVSSKFLLGNVGEVLLKYRNWPSGSISEEKQKQQEFFALKARLKALKNGWFPLWYVIFLIEPFFSFLIPSTFKKPLVRKYIFGQSTKVK